jgi:hypothetical protein
MRIWIRNIACRTVNAPKIYTFPTEMTPWCLERPFIERLQRSRGQNLAVISSILCMRPYILQKGQKGSHLFVPIRVCVYSMMHGGQWCMFMWACFGMLCMGGGGRGREEGGHQCVNVLRRRVAILHGLFQNGFLDRSTENIYGF